MNKVMAIIPARSGSKGVVNKNVRLLGAEPLIAWSLAAARKVKLIERVIVSTDSLEYAELSKKYGAEVPFLRPMAISGDDATDYDFIIHALDWFALKGEEPEYIVHLRPTTPFRMPEMIDSALQSFWSTPGATALRSAHEMSESAYKTLEISPQGFYRAVGSKLAGLDGVNNARQQFPKTYQANGYVDVLSTKFIRATGLLHGDKVKPFLTPRVTEVDTEEDFALLNFELASGSDIRKKIFD